MPEKNRAEHERSCSKRLDAREPAFWDKGLSMIEGFIDELEAMEA